MGAAFDLDLDRKPSVKCRLCGSDLRPSIVWFWPVSDVRGTGVRHRRDSIALTIFIYW